MIYEIESVQEGQNPNDVLLRVNYWHDNDPNELGRPSRTPDFVEDHLIIGVPTDEFYPERTPIGQFVGLDGNPIMEWEVGANGELVEVNPYDIADQIRWVEVDEEAKDRLLVAPVSDRAHQVSQGHLAGDGRLLTDQRPTPRRGRRAAGQETSVAERRRARIVGYIGYI